MGGCQAVLEALSKWQVPGVCVYTAVGQQMRVTGYCLASLGKAPSDAAYI